METQVINRNFPKFLIQIFITTNLPQAPVKSQKRAGYPLWSCT